MATIGRTTPRLRGEPMRRKIEVSSAMAWEALVESHTEQALTFIDLLEDHEPVEESLPRYLREMDLQETMATAIRTRVLTAIEEREDGGETAPDDAIPLRAADPSGEDAPADEDDDSPWNTLLRQPQRVVRDVRRRQRRSEELERIVMLALARAEEAIIETHVENAIGFVALLEGQVWLDRAVQQYLAAVRLAGGRAQTVFQRTMARLAEVHLR